MPIRSRLVTEVPPEISGEYVVGYGSDAGDFSAPFAAAEANRRECFLTEPQLSFSSK